jgi:hypothetical protein
VTNDIITLFRENPVAKDVLKCQTSREFIQRYNTVILLCQCYQCCANAISAVPMLSVLCQCHQCCANAISAVEDVPPEMSDLKRIHTEVFCATMLRGLVYMVVCPSLLSTPPSHPPPHPSPASPPPSQIWQ